MKKPCEKTLLQRYGDDFDDSRAQSGKAEGGVHQNEDYNQFSGELLEQSFPLALHRRKFSEEFYYQQLSLSIPEEQC